MTRLLLLLFLLSLALPVADVTGKWESTVQPDAGSGAPAFTFAQQGEKLTGRYSGTLGEADVTGKVRVDEIKFSLTVKGDLGELTATYTGKVSGDTMKGAVHYGALGDGTFTAKRAK